MNSSRVLRLLAISYILLLTLSITLPYVDGGGRLVNASTIPLVFLAAGALSFVGVIVGCVALLLGKRWGAWCHLVSTAIVIGGNALMPHSPTTPVALITGILIYVTSGTIYGVAFFSDALQQSR